MSTDTPNVPDAPVEAPQAAEAQAQPDLGALMSRMDQIAESVQSLTPQQPNDSWQGPISDLPYAPEPDYGSPEPAYDPGQQYQPGQYEPDYGMDPQQAQQQAYQQLQDYIGQQVTQGIEQHMTPFIRTQKANALEQKYPDLKDPVKAGEVVKATAQYAQRLGKPELARDPELVELVYLAQDARNRASQQTAADGEQDIHLEGSGAAPQAQEMDAATAMLMRNGIDPQNPWG